MLLPGEEWRDVPGYEGYYQVSNKGRVKATGWYKEPRIKVPSRNNGGYLLLSLYKEKKIKNFLVHRLVMLAFSPVDNPARMQVNHIDLNKENCRLENLEWCSPKENVNHFLGSEKGKGFLINIAKGDHNVPYGEAHYRSKLTESDVIAIRQIYAGGCHNMSEIARKFGVSNVTVKRVVRGEVWKHLLGNA